MKNNIGTSMDYVVIGHGTAGQTAAAVLKKVDPESNVTVIEKGIHVAIHPCSLPMVLSGKLSPQDIEERVPRGKVNVLLRSEAKRIDRERKILYFIRDGAQESIQYDKLILATGLSPIIPKIEGMDLEGVGTVWNLETVSELLKYLGNRVVVVGGSATGIEVASELAGTGRDVTLIEAMEQLMPGKVDPPISSMVMNALNDLGVKVMLKTPMERLEGSGGKLTHVVTPKGKIEADTAIIVIGAKPNIEVALNSGLVIGETGGVKVDEYMFTSDPNILAAGDVAEVKDFVSGKPTLTGLASTALVQGRIAAENAAGGKTRYLGALSPFLVSVGDYFFGGVGLSATRADSLKMEYRAFRFSGSDLPKYMPGKENTVIWLITDRKGKLLGGQVFGRRGVRERILFLTAAIYAGFNVEDIRIMEFAYQPEVCDVLEPIAIAAEGMFRKYMLGSEG
jgi:NADPH-dependent 2,4-dienoyl-CoA reductase/sulfur reductase-like enzyme